MFLLYDHFIMQAVNHLPTLHRLTNSAILKVYVDFDVFLFFILLRNSFSTFFHLSFCPNPSQFCLHLFIFLISILPYSHLFSNVLI